MAGGSPRIKNIHPLFCRARSIFVYYNRLELFHIYFIYFCLFQQYLDRGAQFGEAGLNGALFNINLHTNNILQNTKFQITKVLP